MLAPGPRAIASPDPAHPGSEPFEATVLLVEDDDNDAALLVRALRRAGICGTTRVETQTEFVAALAAGPDVIISDVSLPTFSGMAALKLRNELAPAIPFIIVTGTITDSDAAAFVAADVTDYLLKDRLGRLGTAVVRAVTARRTADDASASDRRAEDSRRLARALLEHSTDAIMLIDGAGAVTQANRASTRLFGDVIGRAAADELAERVHPGDLDRVLGALATIMATPGPSPAVTFRVRSADGAWRHLTGSANNLLGDPGVRGILVNARDTTTEIEQLHRIELGQEALVGALARAAEARDPYTAGHQRKVAGWATAIAERLGLPADTIRQIDLGANLHDIGKIAIPAEILTRPGRLGAVERQLVETHAQVGYDILADSGMSEVVTDIVLHHHERLDGSGYPHGLTANDLSPATRIVAVADVFDAMSARRPYRDGLGLAVTSEELTSHRGTRYCPDAVDALLSLDDLDRHGDTAQHRRAEERNPSA